MKEPPADAIAFHSRGVETFDRRYRTARDFRERYNLWTHLIRNYSQPSGEVLDVGCGSGIFSFFSATYNRSVLGVDGSSEMIDCCLRKQARLGTGNVRFEQCRIEELPRLNIRPVDLLLCSSVLEYIDGLASSLAVLSSLLRPGGVMIASLPNKLSLYRMLERGLYRLTGRPAYLAHVKNSMTLQQFNAVAMQHRLVLLEARYYCNRFAVLELCSKLLPPSLLDAMFLCVHKASPCGQARVGIAQQSSGKP